MRTLLTLTLTVAALAACGRPTQAERDERMTKHIERALDDVAATQQQKDRILAVVKDTRAQLRAQKDAKEKTRAALLAQWNAATVDRDAVKLAVDEATSRAIADAHTVVDAGVQIHDTLTPAQRAQLEEKMPTGRARFAFGVAHRMGYGPPTTKEELRARADARFADWMDEIDATDDQRAQLSPLLTSVLDAANPLLATPATLKDAALGAWRSDAVDAAALHALVDAEGKKLTTLASTTADALASAHAVLTPEQRAKVATRMSDHGGCRDDD